MDMDIIGVDLRLKNLLGSKDVANQLSFSKRRLFLLVYTFLPIFSRPGGRPLGFLMIIPAHTNTGLGCSEFKN